MAWQAVRSGFTGPSNKIGGSSEYHGDWKFAKSLPIDQRIAAFDAIAKEYDRQGRVLEFSNAAVSGRRYDPSLSYEQKADLLKAALAAHSHSIHSNFDSIDAYPVLKTAKNRFVSGSVENAPLLIAGLPGQKIVRGTASGYGFYSTVLNDKGEPILKVGHGNIDKPEKESEIIVGGVKPSQSPTTATAPSTQTPATNTGLNPVEIAINLPKELLNLAQEKEKEKPKSFLDSFVEGLLAKTFNQTNNALNSNDPENNPWLIT